MKKNLLKQILVQASVFLFIVILFTPIFIYAEGENNPPGAGGSGRITNPLNTGDSLSGLITAILNNIVMPIGAVLCVVWIIYAGFLYVTAQGNPKAIEKAHSTLLWALVGTGILLGAAGISKVVENTVKSIIN